MSDDFTMIYHEVGQTGLKLPPIIFGTSSLGNLYQALPQPIKVDLIRAMFEQIEAPVALDSAGKYGAGLALAAIGQALTALGIDSDKVIISNKLGWRRVPLRTPEPTFEPGVWVDVGHDAEQDLSYAGILRCWEQGCALLGESYKPQMVSVHDPDEYLAEADSAADRKKRFADILAAYRALAELKQQGQVKAIGVGAKDWPTIQTLTNEVALDWVMLANSMTLYQHPPELLAFMDELAARQIAIINSAVFNAGFLTGGSYFNYRKLEPANPADQPLFQWRENFFSLCQRHQVLPANACVQFGLSHPAVISVALNTSRPERIAQNVASVQADIPAAFWSDLKTEGLIAQDYPYLG